MSVNSRRKGVRGERQWRDELRANGYAARRGQQFSGSPDSPDVVCGELDWIHFEVKHVAKKALFEWMAQAERDCGGAVPVVVHRACREPWLVTMRVADCGFFGCDDGWGPWAQVSRVVGAPSRAVWGFGVCAGICDARAAVLVCQAGGRALWTVGSAVFFKFLRGDLPPERSNNNENKETKTGEIA